MQLKKNNQRKIKIRKTVRIRDFSSFYPNAEWRKEKGNEYKSGTFLTGQSWANLSSQTPVFALTLDT